jgi:hypothetical protein
MLNAIDCAVRFRVTPAGVVAGAGGGRGDDGAVGEEVDTGGGVMVAAVAVGGAEVEVMGGRDFVTGVGDCTGVWAG